MPFYVPLGPRGLILQLGRGLHRILGGMAYWYASRRRPHHVAPAPASERFTVVHR